MTLPPSEIIKCLVFDFDGVLVDSNAIKQNAYYEIFQECKGSKPIIQRVFQEKKAWDRFQTIEQILKSLILERVLPGDTEMEQEIARYAEAYNERCERQVSTCRERPGITECLSRLSKKLPLYINSDTPEEPLRRIIIRRQWGSFFKGVYGRPAKKTETLARISHEEGIKPLEILFFGDSRNDEESAIRFGCNFIRICSDSNDFDANTQHPYISSSAEIEAVLG